MNISFLTKISILEDDILKDVTSKEDLEFHTAENPCASFARCVSVSRNGNGFSACEDRYVLLRCVLERRAAHLPNHAASLLLKLSPMHAIT